MSKLPPSSSSISTIPNKCSTCGMLPITGLKKCSGCSSKYYCSVNCQKQDWRQQHHMECPGAAANVKTPGKNTTTPMHALLNGHAGHNDDALPLNGIRVSFLANLLSTMVVEVAGEEGGEMATSELVEEVLTRVTATKDAPFGGLSLVEYVKSKPEWKNHVSELADSFICHAWQYRWKDLIAALLGYGDAERFVWIDLAVVNQHRLQQSNVEPELTIEKVQQVIRRIKKMEVVCSSQEMRPIPCQRSWCALEIITAIKSKVPMAMIMPPSEKFLLRERICTRHDMVSKKIFSKLFTIINVERVQAKFPKEQEDIMRFFFKLEVGPCNNMLKQTMKKWLGGVLDELIAELIKSADTTQKDNKNEERMAKLANAYLVKSFFHASLEEWVESQQVSEKALTTVRVLMSDDDASQKTKQEMMVLGLNSMASASFALQEYSTAQMHYDEALKVEQPTAEEDALGAFYLSCAKNLKALRKYEEAAAMYVKVVNIMSNLLGDYHPSLAVVLSDLIVCLEALNKNEQVKAYLEIALEIKSRIYGYEHPHTAPLKMHLGRICRNLLCFEEALAHFEKALHINKKAYEKSNVLVGECYLEVADCMKKNCLELEHGERLDDEVLTMRKDALIFAREGVAIYEKLLGSNDEKTKKAKLLWDIIDDDVSLNSKSGGAGGDGNNKTNTNNSRTANRKKKT